MPFHRLRLGNVDPFRIYTAFLSPLGRIVSEDGNAQVKYEAVLRLTYHIPLGDAIGTAGIIKETISFLLCEIWKVLISQTRLHIQRTYYLDMSWIRNHPKCDISAIERCDSLIK